MYRIDSANKENDCTFPKSLAPRSENVCSHAQRTPLMNLSKPFTTPFKRSQHAKIHQRSTRKRVDYLAIFGEDGETKKSPGTKPRDPMADLFRPFRLPSKTLVPSEKTGSLGMMRVPEWKAKPLHDPCGEFAIVLFDPTVDKLPQTESIKQEGPEDPQHPLKKKAKTKLQKSRPEPDYIESSDIEESDGYTQPLSVEIDKTQAAEVVPADKPSSERKEVCKTLQGASLNSLLGISESNADEPELVPVVIDPKLAKILRPHQIEGVKFLYRCTMGFIDPRANGCIMADEMGLGKTLQCITLLWTQLRQSPCPTAIRRGTIQKALVICPSSLVNNWANEFSKWLGPGSINALAIDGKSVKSADLSMRLQEWARADGRRVMHPVLVISYETLRRNAADLGDAEIGLLLADEGHRLKNGDSLTFLALNSLNVKRRVILSGTPIQNDLSEYFSLLNFANPNYLGTRADFRKNYENKILRGRDSEATSDEIELGETKLRELLQTVNKLIIRRTNDILSEYLPVKYEHIVFCGLSDFQKRLYNHYLRSKEVNKLLKGQGTQSLQGINILKKICSHPDLINIQEDVPNYETLVPEDWVPPSQRLVGRNRSGAVCPWYSGKFMVLSRMLARIRADTNDKIVLVSNYTQTLDMIELLCRDQRYGSIRLDGTMAINKRQKLVDRFNDPERSEFVFLLSSKAGGCGINLIGANRLILLDPDWNPAADQQALARIWRDGQKKDCFVYRFISTGTIEEKILQRQSMKQSLSSCVVDEKKDVDRLFSSDMLKELFKYNTQTLCDTHDTFKCKRCSPEGQLVKAPAMLYGDATTWGHYPHGQLPRVTDKLLQQEANEDVVDFVFQYISH